MDELELFCPRCSATELCDSACMLARLRSIGVLRREAKPEPDLLLELFRNSAGKFACHECDQIGLVVRAASPGDWPEARRCEDCGAAISRERLEVVPGARRCVACEGQAARAPQSEAEYCPRCGAVMTVRLSSGTGISRYVVFCPSCKR